MANSLELAEIFNQSIDEILVQESVTTKMQANPKRVRYEGGDTVKILKKSTTGFGDYDRAGSTHFPAGTITTTWESFSFDYDRGVEFEIDEVDNEDQFVDIAAVTMSDFAREHAVPEVDACRFAKIWGYALGYGNVSRSTPTVSTILALLKADMKAVRKVTGRKPMTVYMSYDAFDLLAQSDSITKNLDVNSNNGNVETQIRMLDGAELVEVPDERFFTEITLSTTDGFSNPATASAINWVVVTDSAVTGIVKLDRMRVFSPDVWQKGDGWGLQARKHHGCWVYDNMLPAIYVNYAGVDAPVLTATIAGGTVSGTTKFTATAGTGNALGYVLGAASAGVKYLDLMTGVSGAVYPYTSGADISATAGQYLTMIEYDTTTLRVEKVLEDVLESGDITA